MKKLLAVVTVSAALAGIWLSGSNNSQIVSAQGCTIKGKQLSAGDGTLICDCTTPQTQTCNCVITCPPKPGDEIELEGVAN